MTSITPIGTCRIHTPLSRAVARYPIELDLRRNYGFVHTSDEALQQLRFLQGEKQFRADVLPLVFRPGSADAINKEVWQPSDLNIVEISSAKRVLCGDDAVQINYLYRHFGDFFGSSERARRFWNLVRGGHLRELQYFLDRQPSYRILSPADRDLLSRISTEQQTFKTIKQDMAEIVERLGKERTLFVTHVNAATPDGEVIPSRDRLIRWVKLAADQLGAAVFDPTEIMVEFGQELALENGGLDLTHYQPGFSDRLFDVLHERHVAAIAGTQLAGSEGNAQRQEMARLAARLETMLGGDDFIGGAREVYAALERQPDSLPLIFLRGMVRHRIGDFRGALTDLSQGGRDTALTQPMQVALLEALNACGQYDEALSLAGRLVREESDNAEVHRIAASAAEKLDQAQLAADHNKQAYRMDRSDLSAALRALVLLIDFAPAEEIDDWRREILENIGASSSGAFELCVWAVRQREEELFIAALPLVAQADKWSTIDLVEEAAAEALPKAIAAALPIAVELGRLEPQLAERRSRVLHGALEQARTFADSGLIEAAYQIARAIAGLPTLEERQTNFARLSGEGRRLVRDLTVVVRKEIAEVQLQGDAQAVVELGQKVGDIILEDGKSATAVARALQSSGNAEAGLDLLKRMSPDATDDVLVKRSTARLAQALGDYATAIEMYGSLRRDDSAQAGKFKQEIERFFEIAEPRSLKQLTLLARGGDFEEAMRLARSIGEWIGSSERLEREKARMLKLLRVRLKQIQDGEADLDEREQVLQRMAQISPDDSSVVRRLALEFMRQFRFAEAKECWEKLSALDPGNESAERNRVRCATLAQRRASASAQVIDFTA